MITGREGHLCLCRAFSGIRCHEAARLRNNALSSLSRIITINYEHRRAGERQRRPCCLHGRLGSILCSDRRSDVQGGSERRLKRGEGGLWREKAGRRPRLSLSEPSLICLGPNANVGGQRSKLCTSFPALAPHLRLRILELKSCLFTHGLFF